jgi:predicted aspartyl protease
MSTVGRVTSDREAVVPITVENSRGASRTVQAVLDTGFTGFLTLTAHHIEDLALPSLGRERVLLASGDPHAAHTDPAAVVLAGRRYRIRVLQANESLVGMRLLWGRELRVECTDGGRVALLEPSADA